jgi:hypothetical protein
MDVGRALLQRARERGTSSLAVVGTSKNAGKSVVVSALADALARDGKRYGLCTVGRDGEAIDAVEGTPKPRYFLRSGAVVATAASLLPRSPACEVLEVTRELSALGRIVVARVRAPGFFEIAGPPSAGATRRIVRAFAAYVPFVLIDGAVDRVAALRGGDDAVVIAVGAASAPTMGHALDDVATLVARLSIRAAEPAQPGVRIDGALTREVAGALVSAGETRAVVVEDATRVALPGRSFETFARKLDVRAVYPLHPIACTVAPLWTQRAFEPRAFARAVAERTGLPVYDVFAGTEDVPGAA